MDLSVGELRKLAILFNMTTDNNLNCGKVVPAGVKVEGKTGFEKLHLINQLQEDDKQTVYRIIDTILTKQKFQIFFEQNLQTIK